MYLMRVICRSVVKGYFLEHDRLTSRLYHPRKVSLPQQLLMYISSGRAGACALWVLTVDNMVSLSWMAMTPSTRNASEPHLVRVS